MFCDFYYTTTPAKNQYPNTKKADALKTSALSLAGVEGFEPTEWWSQSPLPYHLAIPQFAYSFEMSKQMVGIAGFEPAE